MSSEPGTEQATPEVAELLDRIRFLEDCVSGLVAFLHRQGVLTPPGKEEGHQPIPPRLLPATGPNGAVTEGPVAPWAYLVARPHPWRRQLYLKGRNLTVRQLVGTVKANGWGEEEAASNLDLPVEAIREALRYAAENEELLTFETAYENLMLARKGYGRGTRAVPR
jgi:uncharacterized protein (DUF433 family)